MTIVKANTTMRNAGVCFTEGKTYETSKPIHTESSLMDMKLTNDQGQPHIIGSWWRNFSIVDSEEEVPMPNYITPAGTINDRGEGTRIDPNYTHPAFPLRSPAVTVTELRALMPAEPMSIGELILRYFPNARAEQVKEALIHVKN